MNNIEILEEFIEQCNSSYPDGKECVAIYPEQIEALENLIQKNKELKEELEYTKKQIPQDKIFYYSEKDYILKSKVKEKIKEYNIPIFDLLDKLPIPRTIERGCGAKDGIIYVLQELLEGE